MMRLLKRFNTIQGSLLLHELSFVLLILLSATIGVSWVQTWHKSSQESLRLTSMGTHMQHIRGDLYRQMKEVFDAMFLKDLKAREEYYRYSQKIEREINQIQLLSKHADERKNIARISKAYDLFFAETRDYLNPTVGPLSEQQLLLLDEPLEKFTLNELEMAFSDFEQYLQNRQGQLADDHDRWLAQVFWLEPLPIILALGLLIWSRRFVRRQVLTPLSVVISGAKRIAQGEWQYALPAHGVHDLQNLTQAINQMASALIANHDSLIEARKQAEMAELIPLVAHNIRNPLAGIRAAAQVSLQEENLPATNQEVLRDIIVAVDRLERWVTSLLMYLHPLQPHFSDAKLTTLMDNALSLIQLQLADKHLKVIREGWAADVIKAQLDTNLVEQTLCNLLQNAIEAAPERSQIKLRYQQIDNDTVCMEIDDKGRGINQPLLTAANNETKSAKPLHYGLGLPFAQRVMELHHGQISHIDLQPGTRVRLQLPFSQPETD